MLFCLGFSNTLFAVTPPNVDLDTLAYQKSEEEVAQEADEILAELAALRGITLKGKVKIVFADKTFFSRYYLRHLQEQYSAPKKENYEAAFQALGLLKPGEDLFSSYLSVFLSVVQGLFDPETKTLFMLQGCHSRDIEKVMAHELVHALQDQQFDLKKFLAGNQDLNMDEQFARTSLVEGEAEGLSLDWRLQEEGRDFTRIEDIAPLVEQGNLFEKVGLKALGKKTVSANAINFPYVYGVTFFQHWVRLNGWKNVGQLYLHPPQTTQQIMNSGYFFPRLIPFIKVKLADLSGGPLKQYRKIWENSLGEFGWQTIFRNYLGDEESAKAVTGWEGDTTQAYKKDKESMCLLTSFLDFRDESSSKIFFKTAKHFLGKKDKILSWIRDDETISWAALSDGRESYLERFGKRVVWLEEIPQGLTPRVRASLWDFQRVSGVTAHQSETHSGSP